MSSSQGSQVQTLVIELSENQIFSNDYAIKFITLLFSFLYRFLELRTSFNLHAFCINHKTSKYHF
jgi:hypothetical protein